MTSKKPQAAPHREPELIDIKALIAKANIAAPAPKAPLGPAARPGAADKAGKAPSASKGGKAASEARKAHKAASKAAPGKGRPDAEFAEALRKALQGALQSDVFISASSSQAERPDDLDVVGLVILWLAERAIEQGETEAQFVGMIAAMASLNYREASAASEPRS